MIQSILQFFVYRHPTVECSDEPVAILTPGPEGVLVADIDEQGVIFHLSWEDLAEILAQRQHYTQTE